ncbi:MAG TPA: hypothetical protein VHN11_09885 [Xanthobacteraceae bacterium]|jgi:hypothetical protein|nr:hypothetical protein [Xanthobacteraceae bacterium]
MSPESIQSFLELAIGFSVAGLLASGYQILANQPASFRLLEGGPSIVALAAVPFLVFTAPFIIMRNTVRGRRIEGRSFQFVMLATVLSGLWSLMSGTVVVMIVEAITSLSA